MQNRVAARLFEVEAWSQLCQKGFEKVSNPILYGLFNNVKNYKGHYAFSLFQLPCFLLSHDKILYGVVIEFDKFSIITNKIYKNDVTFELWRYLCFQAPIFFEFSEFSISVPISLKFGLEDKF